MPDKVAGKRVRCPKCQEIIQVPALSPTEPAPSGEAVSPAAPELWHLQTEDGETYGPVAKSEIDDWVSEGRVTADCQLLREGDDQWQWATEVYPQLEEGAPIG